MDLNNSWDSFDKYTSSNFKELKTILVDAGVPQYSKGCKKDIDDHLKMIEKEFSNRTVLEFYHSWLIVNIRRKIDIHKHINLFFQLWSTETDFLLKNLSSRWLISACDTIMDYSEDTVEVSVSMAAILFISTIKLYETEELMIFEEYNIKYSNEIPQTPIALFDGITAFRIGSGDMIANMIKRITLYTEKDKISYQILIELLKRTHRNNTIYKRMADRHKSKKTRWWGNNQFLIEKERLKFRISRYLGKPFRVLDE